MKKMFVSLAILLISGSVFAQVPTVPPGAIEKHELPCMSTDHKVGMDVMLVCFTQALPPQNDLRGCNLVFRAVAPNAQPFTEALRLVGQSANDARLRGAQGTVVELNKRNMTANVFDRSQLEYICR